MRAACQNGASGAPARRTARTRGTNPARVEQGLLDAFGGARTVPPMTETTPTPPGPKTPGPILDLADVQARYRIGKTRAVALVAWADFPRSVVPGMHRYPLAALEAWEATYALAGTLAETRPAAPVIVAPPASGRPGRRPGRAPRVA